METTDPKRVAVIIEDDADIRNLLETVLREAGFETIATANGLDGIQAVRAYDPTITTLDVSMPGIDGFETAKRLRTFSSTYLIMLTARDDEIDTLQGLEAGADDYLTKPFRPRELRARVEAMLRRPRQRVVPGMAEAAQPPVYYPPARYPYPIPPGYPAPGVPVAPGAPVAYPQPTPVPAQGPTPPPYVPAPGTPAPAQPSDSKQVELHASSAAAVDKPTYSFDPSDGWIAHNGLQLNPEMRIVVNDEGTEVDLTRSEFDLLAALMESKRRVRSKADLALMLRGESYVTSHFVGDADKRAIEVHMANLRRKLGDSITSPRWIETVRGVGYRLAAIDEG